MCLSTVVHWTVTDQLTPFPLIQAKVITTSALESTVLTDIEICVMYDNTLKLFLQRALNDYVIVAKFKTFSNFL